MLLRFASFIPYLFNSIDMYALFFFIYSYAWLHLPWPLIQFLIWVEICIIGHLLYYAYWTILIVLWKCFGLQLRYVHSLFLYAWFHLICMSCMTSILLGFCYYHLYLILVSWYLLIYKSIIIITSTWLVKTFI